MALVAKTIVATGVSSSLLPQGFEAIKQLLQQPQPYRVILGARDTHTTNEAYKQLPFDRATHSVTVLPLQLADLSTVKTFACQALDQLGGHAIDYLIMNAGISKDVEDKSLLGYKWCETVIVNHFSQHYLVHLLRQRLVAHKARIVFVSSGGVRRVTDTDVLQEHLQVGSGQGAPIAYAESKFVQLLSAHWWRRQLAGQCHVVAVSPGLIANTGLARYSSKMKITTEMPDAKTVPQGAKSVLAALTRSDFPQDAEQIFLTSWGEWWPKDVYEKTLDKGLQDKWCPDKEQLEEEGHVA
ncbi:hypothetical protein CDD82_5924 [Ophiocordyceps australis]|uniref:Ketoreductase (KR) domain-containing protein n=1 Tax=Ophiocordyceps australis TaxID=1399860 RepID=A0A2C5YZR8_9HYPO|nr:hypothetical protein CDD82_5924 [Ophiocordyceps australis]